ncbi:MAG: pilus assembly protein TadG, partial [Alphaproteobacteria bacterium]|nr:pilus assembly protein TadG [Alphaproteobacteria bacterium]
ANYLSSNEDDYSGFGLHFELIGDMSRSDAQDELDDKLSTICTNIKATETLVYTITFQVSSSSIQTLMSNCATDSSKYYNSPSNDELERAFRAIGAELSNLRIGG